MSTLLLLLLGALGRTFLNLWLPYKARPGRIKILESVKKPKLRICISLRIKGLKRDLKSRSEKTRSGAPKRFEASIAKHLKLRAK